MKEICGFLENNKCSALKDPKCYRPCPFFKTPEEIEEGIQTSYRRIRKLPFFSQINISEKYYDGKKPWEDING